MATFLFDTAAGEARTAVPFGFSAPRGDGGNGSNFNDTPDRDTSGEDVNLLVATETENFGAGTFLALDDTGGSDHDNHDDMVIRVEEVPAPATLALLDAGLLGLGAAAGRRTRD